MLDYYFNFRLIRTSNIYRAYFRENMSNTHTTLMVNIGIIILLSHNIRDFIVPEFVAEIAVIVLRPDTLKHYNDYNTCPSGRLPHRWRVEK